MKTFLTTGTDAKTIKGQKFGYLTGILYLAPHRIAGGANLCPHATAGCKLACLYTAGRGGFTSVQQARIKKTRVFLENPSAFVGALCNDVKRLQNKAEKVGLTLCIRLNGTSDIAWESIKHAGKTIFEHFPTVQFYDYTKSPKRAFRACTDLTWPKNYKLTFSRSENNQAEVEKILSFGGNVAVVFSNKNLPSEWAGFPVIDGDKSDLRFLDRPGTVVGLYAKGKAKQDKAGFVIVND